MDKLHCFLGLKLDEALHELRKCGWQVDVEYTGTNMCKNPGEARVARIKCTSSKRGVVTAVHQDTGGGGASFGIHNK
ncbi:MAG TPA: hypothetical protein VFD15_01360 [Clostridia bacterium]|nr:hypothetical protein [Clostridia bacterium]